MHHGMMKRCLVCTNTFPGMFTIWIHGVAATALASLRCPAARGVRRDVIEGHPKLMTQTNPVDMIGQAVRRMKPCSGMESQTGEWGQDGWKKVGSVGRLLSLLDVGCGGCVVEQLGGPGLDEAIHNSQP
jgi:hypothetical protein